ncbi:DUF2087 domain-containing protein [Brachybacterium muris]|uniref:DUF2087 domain-containing protein n=1 Tax=Brachybacterium muris TaxID=219301 RepID=UPI00223C52A2|nr:DUF2087 domain-containing protein [Brachybacterium muris]MCT1653391.1 DUF2087 domain-containing protein [Brachybacterium muris]
MTPAPAMDLDAALGRARMLFSMLSSPKLRAALGERLTGGERPAGTENPVGTQDSRPDGPLARIDWLQADGQVDAPLLREVVDALSLMRSSDAILEVPRLESLPPREVDRIAASGRIARMVFERLGADGALSEAELNAGISMIASDPALVRRDAVDSGVLERAADGSRYRLAQLLQPPVALPPGSPALTSPGAR